jgi:pimeloyl-ACP methyl ester carboxylesterase
VSRSSAIRIASLSVGGPVILAAATIAINNLLAPGKSLRQRPTFELFRAGPKAPDRVFLGMHGISDGAAHFGHLRAFMQERGQLVLATNGCHIDDTAPLAIEELQLLGLDSHETVVIGFSLGTQTAVQFLRTFKEKMGRPVDRAILVSGMADASDVIWPNWFLPYMVRALRPGPIVQRVWNRYWSCKLQRALAADSASETVSKIQSKSLLHPGAVLSGAQLLARGVRLQPNEFAGTKVLVIEHSADSRVRRCFTGWRHAAPGSTLVTIFGPGHASFDKYIEQYCEGIAPWLRST